MRTFADFKRLAQVGARFERVFHGNPENPPTKIRTVNHVQGNAITFRINEENSSSERSNRSWFWFPKSRKEYRIENGTLVLLNVHGNPRMTLKPVR